MNVMTQTCYRGLLLVFLIFATTSGALAEKRVALIIGNSAYANVEALKNPQHDATSLSEKLKAIGFDKVTLKLDLASAAVRRELGQFARDAAGANIALVYFAGHGIEVGGTNYLIPTDAKLAHIDDVDFEAIRLSTVMRSLDRANQLKLVILDACRNNPFRASMAGAGTSRSVGRGLARVTPTGSDTLVAYAAKENTIADDGNGRHSPYATALLKHIATPNLDVRLLFGRVRDEVLARTGGKQEPFTYGSLSGQILTLVKSEGDSGDVTDHSDSGQTAVDREALFWSSVKDSKNSKIIETYLKQYPNGQFADLARAKIAELKQQSKTAEPETGVTSSQHRSADELFRLGVAADRERKFSEAFKWFLEAARNGVPEAMFNVAVMYRKGEGTARDAKSAADWYERAALKDYVPAMHSYAVTLAYGHGTKPNQRLAAAYMFLALRNGSGAALKTMTIRGARFSKSFKRELQRLMKEEGVYDGAVDGAFGPSTKSAIRKLAGTT